jgi:integrase
LRRSFIDREREVIRLPADVTKESRAKVIPMNRHVKAVLAELTPTIHHDFVFTYQHEPIKTPGGLHNSFLTACKKAGIPHGQDHPEGIVFHDIRRTVKTNMLSAGMDKIYRDMILGHSLTGMDAHYISPSEKDLHRAMAIYTAWFDAEVQSVAHFVAQEIKKG